MPKTYKCNYNHCSCDDELTDENRVVIGNRSYHKKCAEIKELIIKIRDYYIENVSNTVVVSQLVNAINNIVFTKEVEAEYLMFCLENAVKSGKQIKSPYYLHYLVDNNKNKSEYKSKSKVKENIISKVKAEITTEFNFDSAPEPIKVEEYSGFEKILKRRK